MPRGFSTPRTALMAALVSGQPALATTHARSNGAEPWPGRGEASVTKSAGKGARILIVEARYYDDIADALLAGATKALQEAGAAFDGISVPGSLEIPTAIAIALDAARAPPPRL